MQLCCRMCSYAALHESFHDFCITSCCVLLVWMSKLCVESQVRTLVWESLIKVWFSFWNSWLKIKMQQASLSVAEIFDCLSYLICLLFEMFWEDLSEVDSKPLHKLDFAKSLHARIESLGWKLQEQSFFVACMFCMKRFSRNCILTPQVSPYVTMTQKLRTLINLVPMILQQCHKDPITFQSLAIES